MFVDPDDIQIHDDSTHPLLCVNPMEEFYISYESEKYLLAEEDGMLISQAHSDNQKIGLMYQIIVEYLIGRYSP